MRAQGYEVAFGALNYAPIGSISNPSGTYGVAAFSDEDSFPGGAAFCDCIQNDNTSVASVCRAIEPPHSAHSWPGNPEEICPGAFVLRPGDAVATLLCTPPPGAYFGWQTSVQAKWDATRKGRDSCTRSASSPTRSTSSRSARAPAARPRSTRALVVTTADAATAALVRRAFVGAGLGRSGQC